VERDALNEPSEGLGAALSRLRFHREPLSTGDPTPSAGTRRCNLFPVVMPETDGVRSYLRRSQIKGSLPFGAGARPLALIFPLVCLPDQENEIDAATILRLHERILARWHQNVGTSIR
jgi:hypothetical protein